MKNNKIGSIIKNEVERSIKNKWFVILNFLLLIITIVGMNFNNFRALLKKNNVSISHVMQIYVEDKDNLAYDKIIEAFKENTDVIIEKINSVEELKNDDRNDKTKW